MFGNENVQCQIPKGHWLAKEGSLLFRLVAKKYDEITSIIDSKPIIAVLIYSFSTR